MDDSTDSTVMENTAACTFNDSRLMQRQRTREISSGITSLRTLLPIAGRMTQQNALQWTWYYIKFLETYIDADERGRFIHWLLNTHAVTTLHFDKNVVEFATHLEPDGGCNQLVPLPNLERLHAAGLDANHPSIVHVDRPYMCLPFMPKKRLPAPDKFINCYQQERKKAIISTAEEMALKEMSEDVKTVVYDKCSPKKRKMISSKSAGTNGRSLLICNQNVK